MFRYDPLDVFTWILQNLVCPACNFNKKTLQHSYFPASFAKIFKSTFFVDEHLRVTASKNCQQQC